MKEKLNIENAKKLLIVVDMIEGFMNKGVLADPKMMRIVPEVTKIIEYFLEENYPIVAFRDVHNELSPEHDSFPGIPKHCLNKTQEIELIEPLKKYEEKMIVIDKNATMGITAPIMDPRIGYANLLNMLNALSKLKELIIVGVCTDICVMNNAIPIKNHFNQINRRVDIIVPKNAVDTYDIPGVHNRDEWNEMAFRFMSQGGIDVVETYELKKGLK